MTSVCSTRGARTSTARSAASAASGARNRLASTVCGKHARHPPGMLPLALLARDGRVGLAHRAQSLKLFPTILAVILIYWHRLTPVEIRPLFYPRFHLTSTHLIWVIKSGRSLCLLFQRWPTRDPVAHQCESPCSWCAAVICWAARRAG